MSTLRSYFDKNKNFAKVGYSTFTIRLNSGHYPDTKEGKFQALTENTQEYNIRKTAWKKYYYNNIDSAQASINEFAKRIKQKEKYTSWWQALTTPMERKSKLLKVAQKQATKKITNSLNLKEYYEQYQGEKNLSCEEFISQVAYYKSKDIEKDYGDILKESKVQTEAQETPENIQNVELDSKSNTTILEYLVYRLKQLDEEKEVIEKKRIEVLEDIAKQSQKLLKS